MSDYGISVTLPLDFADAVERTRAALAEQGFGVLTEIDVTATMKAKLDVDVPPYLILGACNPPLAHRAISAEPSIGLLLPCNVVVREDRAGTVHVEFLDPKPLFELTGRAEVEPLATEVRARLQRVMNAL